MAFNKYSGILCHITSLPNSFGVGDFGPSAYHFIDLLAQSNQHYWQILPLGNTDDSGCPYSTDSAFGCAEFYVSPELVIQKFGLSADYFDKYKFQSDRVDFHNVKLNKLSMLEEAFKLFTPDNEFQQFLNQEKDWIEDYALFRALCESRGNHWPSWNYKSLSPQEEDRVLFFKFTQYLCFSQLMNLKKYANARNVKIVGDLPIFVSYNSMDVWKHPEQFLLNGRLEMDFETGAAPDDFSDTGQKWGTPVYNWNVQKKEDFRWWDIRLKYLKRYFDVIRIDHFRGFCATWISRVSEKDAVKGRWYAGPGADLFNSLTDYPEIFAEDLGFITEDVNSLRDQFQFPTMKVFQFMSPDLNNPHKLQNYCANAVAYSGTHDCNTLVGWYQQLNTGQKLWLERELQVENPDNWDMLKVLMETPAQVVLIQIQDLLGLDSSARFNYPGTVVNTNWTWKLNKEQFQQIDWKKLAQLCQSAHRITEKKICG